MILYVVDLEYEALAGLAKKASLGTVDYINKNHKEIVQKIINGIFTVEKFVEPVTKPISEAAKDYKKHFKAKLKEVVGEENIARAEKSLDKYSEQYKSTLPEVGQDFIEFFLTAAILTRLSKAAKVEEALAGLNKAVDKKHNPTIHRSGGDSSHFGTDDHKSGHADATVHKKTDVPENIIVHEQYKTELRSLMEKPHVKDQKLFEIVDDIYRPNAKIGSGSAAAAARHEILTGESVGGKQHIQKVGDQTNRLEKWIISNPTAAAGDRAAAQNILLDLKDALK